ncbi:response regulator (plasmid) [Rhizobium leguminosarum bv. trifolii]|nr:response regulator [Rhizobium leguminosarum bv. trifolii]
MWEPAPLKHNPVPGRLHPGARPDIGKAVALVVEDSEIIRMGAVDLVRSAGYEAFEASNADEAIRILESRVDIDLVFTDVQMPRTMDGIKLSHYIRDRWPPVKLIVASGKAILEESSLPEGSRFFPKPYSDHAIADAMAGMLSGD